MKKGAEAGVFPNHPSRVLARGCVAPLAPIVRIAAFLLDNVRTSNEFVRQRQGVLMHRFLIGCVLAILLGTQSGFAQTTAVPARTIQTAVLLSDPRGDGALVITVPPGVVVQLIGARNGEWYEARTIGPVARVGWIHRTVIELLPADAALALPVAVPPSANAPVPTPQGRREDIPRPIESDFVPGRTELIVDGALSGWNASGITVEMFQLDGLVGVVVSPHFEIVGSTSVSKASGLDAFGSFGGGLLVNFRDAGPVVPFVGGVVGRGFGASALFGGLVTDPTFVNVSAGFRVLTRGGGGALIVRPFYERYFNSSEFLPTFSVNRFGVSLGAAILF